jgi:hypothetical protein
MVQGHSALVRFVPDLGRRRTGALPSAPGQGGFEDGRHVERLTDPELMGAWSTALLGEHGTLDDERIGAAA